MMIRVNSVVLGLLGMLLFSTPTFAIDGHLLHGVGAVNESMGGAGTATRGDLLGSLAWNPAGTGFMQELSADISLGIVIPEAWLSSHVDVGGAVLEGARRRSKSTEFISGSFAVSYGEKDDPITLHFGSLAAAGLGVNYRESPSNPILFQQPAGLGRIKSDYRAVRIPFGVSIRPIDLLAIGFSVVGGAHRARLDPAVFTRPDDANGDGSPTYPPQRDFAFAVGLGFQLGAQLRVLEDRLAVGVSFQTPIFFERLSFDSRDETGGHRHSRFELDLPPVVSVGLEVKPLTSTRVAIDVRWIGYDLTRGFKRHGYAADGSVKGLGWDDIWVVGLGVEHELLEDVLALRVGYNYGENPIRSGRVFFNVGAPVIVEHHLGFGASVTPMETVTIHAGYYYMFANRVRGAFVLPGVGGAPGTRVKAKLSGHEVSLGATLHF